jgi:hypothetical protein
VKSKSTQWSLRGVAVVLTVALAAVTGVATAEAAAPGEERNWLAQTYDNGLDDIIVNSPDTMVEEHVDVMYNGFREVHNVRVWFGWDYQINISVDGSLPFHVPSQGLTRVAPRVVFDGSAVVIMHTGTNGEVYLSRNTHLDNLGASWNWTGWSQVAIQTLRTNDPVSIVRLTGHPGQLYLAWRGLNQNAIYGSFFNGSWSNPAQISNGNSSAAPGLVWNQSRNRLFAFITGLSDPNIYEAHQDYGQGWTNFARVGYAPQAPVGPPAGGTFPNGDMELTFRGANHRIFQAVWPRWQDMQGWNEVTGGLLARAAPYVLIVAALAYVHGTRDDGNVNFKIVRRDPS